MNKIFKSAVILSFLFSFVSPLMAAGLAVEPSKLKFELTAGQTTEQKLTIENISAQEVIYQLYFDELNEALTVDQPTLRLTPGAKGTVTVSATSPKSGIFVTNLSIVGQELDRRQFNVAFGAKVPITLAVNPNAAGYLTFQNIFFLIIVLGLIVMSFLFIILKKRQRHFWLTGINLLRHRPWYKKLF